MAPIYSTDGRLIGHVDMTDCIRNHHSVIVRNRSRSSDILSPLDYDRDIVNKVNEIFCIPLYEVIFECESQRISSRKTIVERDVQRISNFYLVVDEVPDWFWNAYSIVKFSPKDWRSL